MYSKQNNTDWTNAIKFDERKFNKTVKKKSLNALFKSYYVYIYRNFL